MFPLLPFAAGILTGAAAIKLLKANRAKDALDKTRSTLDKVQTGLRNATVSGLTIVESSTANLRSKLATPSGPPAAEPVQAPEAAAAPAPQAEAAPAAPKRARKKPAAQAGEAGAAPRARRRKPEGEAS